MRVKDALKTYMRGARMAEGSVLCDSDADLMEEMNAVSQRNQLYFQLCFAAVLLLFTGTCVLAVRFLNDPSRLGTLFAVTGVSIVGLIVRMVFLWRQKVTADIIAVLANSLQPGDLRPVIEVMAAKL